MKIKNGDLFRLVQALGQLGAEKFPIAFSFKVSKIIQAINVQFELYQEHREKLIETYAKRDEDGEKISKDGMNIEVMEGWKEELAELDAIEGDEIQGIKASELEKACEDNRVNLSAMVVYGILPILIDEE